MALPSSRTKHLEKSLAVLQFNMALKAFDLVIKEMCTEKGYSRHNGTHYYYHLVDVAQKLLNFGIRDETIITAALLHDLVEDVPSYTIEDIERLFNPDVAHIVHLVSKNTNLDFSIDENQISYLKAIADDFRAALVKTADRMHNFATLLDASPEKRLRKALETEKFYIPFFKECREKYQRYDYIFFEAKTQIEPQLWMIKLHHEQLTLIKQDIEETKKQLEEVTKQKEEMEKQTLKLEKQLNISKQKKNE